MKKSQPAGALEARPLPKDGASPASPERGPPKNNAANVFVRDFQRAVQAGFTLLAVLTAEEARARQLIARACGGLPVVYWTAACGVPIGEALERATASDARQV